MSVGTVPRGQQYRYSEVPFFSKEAVHSSLDSLAGADHLVIYCGAGVTFDYTNLDWTSLIVTLFVKDGDTNSKHDIERIVNMWDSRIAGSAYKRRFLLGFNNDLERADQAIANKLHTALYAEAQWSIGGLARNIAACAGQAILEGRRVTIVTTNYDNFLEIEIEKRAADPSSAPSMRIHSRNYRIDDQGQPEELPDQLITDSKLPGIDIVHLHGRIPLKGEKTFPQVITEIDYANTRDQNSQYLRGLFAKDDVGVLIVGVSITDPPLVEALAKTADSAHRTIAIMPIEATGFCGSQFEREDTMRLVKPLLDRAQLLGVDLLMADFKSQVAQYLVELQKRLRTTERYGVWDQRYGERLKQWRAAWRSSDHYLNPGELNRALISSHKNVLSVIRKALQDDGVDWDPQELTRLELWARSGDETTRYVELAGTSGVIISERLSPQSRETFALSSPMAAVRALVSGRPEQHWMHDEDLAAHPDTMWKSFLAVPILDVSGTGVPLGSVVLASSLATSAIGTHHSLRNIANMSLVVKEMIAVGRSLLAV